MNGLRCRNWRAEAILRLLENNLEIAERPEELVVYAAHAKAARGLLLRPWLRSPSPLSAAAPHDIWKKSGW